MAEDTHGMGIPLPADSTPIHQYPAIARQMGEKVAEILAGGLTAGMEDLAAESVGREVDRLDLIDGDDARLPKFATTSKLLFVLLDSLRQETWLGVNATDGGPSDWAVELIRRALGVGPAEAAGYLFALTDKNRNLTDLTIRSEDGQFAEFVIERLRTRILAGGTAATAGRVYADAPYTPGADVFPITADTKRVAGWGSSSMTGIEWRFKGWFNSKGSEYYAGGRSGEIIEQTAARMGSAPALVTLPDNRVPASGSVPVTLSNVPLTASLKTYPGRLAGIAGTLSYQASPATYLFTRTGSGAARTITKDAPFIPDAGSYRDAVALLWMGKNNLGQYQADAKVIKLTDASFDWLAPLHKRALVLGHFADSNTAAGSAEREQILTVNAAHKARYGRMFIDVYAYLTGSQVWADTGISPTAEDRAAQSIGNKPPSLSADNGHLNDAGYIAINTIVQQRLTELGWY